MARTLVAFALAPMLGVVVGDAICAVLFQWGFGLFTLFGALAAYPVVLVIGFPLFVLLRQLRWFQLGPILVCGVVIAVVAWSLVFWPFSGPSFEAHGLRYGLFGLLSAVAGALTFWSIAKPVQENAGDEP